MTEGEFFTNARGTAMVRRPCGTCGEPFELRAAVKTRHPNCSSCRKPTLGPTPSGYGYLQADFGPILEEIVAAVDKRRRQAFVISADEGSGAIEWIAGDVAMTLGISYAAALRRLWGYRSGERRVVCSEFADAVLMSVGRMVENEDDIPRLYPTTKAAAFDLVSVAAEEAGEIVSVDELQRRASALIVETTEIAYGLREAPKPEPVDTRPPQSEAFRAASRAHRARLAGLREAA